MNRRFPNRAKLSARWRPASGSRWQWLWALLFLAAHLPLSLLVYRAPVLGVLHALVVLAFALRAAVGPPERLPQVVWAAAYIVGAEVLWRMSQTPIFWESGKYAISLVFLVAIVRHGFWRVPPGVLLYFVVLLPSCLLAITGNDWAEARNNLSFNMSGPFALLMCAWFLSQVRLTASEFGRTLLSLLAPLLGVAVVTLFGTVTTEDLVFTRGSNFATSGGFGPNQVSSVLGLGGLLIVLCLLAGKANKWLKSSLFALLLLFIVQSAMTFSRGGLYNAGGALLAASVYLIRDNRSRRLLLLLVPALAIALGVLILPRLNTITDGALEARFKDTDRTGRDEIVQVDLAIWLEHPLLGVGPGNADDIRRNVLHSTASHTEMSRLLAEHGSLGLIAIGAFFLMVIGNLRRATSLQHKACIAAFTAWSFLFMLNAGMRIAAPAFIYGLSFLRFKVGPARPEPAPVKVAALSLRRRFVPATRRVQPQN